MPLQEDDGSDPAFFKCYDVDFDYFIGQNVWQ